MNINSLCVCGAGTMGSGIAQAAAQAGIPVILYELNPVVLENAKTGMQKSLQGLTDKGKISETERKAVSARIRYTGDLQDCLADIIIEGIVEKPEAKISLFNQLAEINHAETVFASNTSSLSVTAIAAAVRQPQRVIGMHFFNPATIMKLVEVVLTEMTSGQARETVTELAQRMGKTPVYCKDAPGFIVNRVARPYYIETLRLAEEENISCAQADLLLESAGFRMGPFRLMDLIGNDVNYTVSCSVYEQLGRPERLKPSRLQEEKVKTGQLGRKSGRGYYEYREKAAG